MSTDTSSCCGRSICSTFQRILLKGVLDVTCQQKLIQDKVGLLKVEDGVWLVHDVEIFVRELHVSAGQLQRDELVALTLDVSAEVKAGLFLIAYLEAPPLHEATRLGLARQKNVHKLPNHRSWSDLTR